MNKYRHHAHPLGDGASSSIGQTYILEKDGQLYESRVSFSAS
jgi:hypothetical protein